VWEAGGGEVLGDLAGAVALCRRPASRCPGLHNPVRLAKALSTLDVLSGGRVMVTVGTGMAAGEFSALGVDFRRRGRIADEYIRAMKVLWTADEPEFHGEFVDFADIVFEPRPLRRPHPPLFVGGRSIFALRRAARMADGWAPSGAQGGTGPWLSGPADLPAFLTEARRCDGFAAREHDFEIAGPRPRSCRPSTEVLLV
jgi:alkanesulfonate monooxygenase SsuD/methylene tetrahydromethanopterin reductase-like flavin-dependent oxidoreductase (luciferase family)